ncbi:MAG: TolC family protein [Planctomycetota bacterium]|nr:TolC family protein [Planctomycetota bacterium]
MVRLHLRWTSPIFALLCSACVLAPDELKDERDRLDRAGTRYAVDLGERTLPVLPEAPSYDDWLRRAFQVSGDLETAWQEWRAALAEVSAASAWPNTNVELDFEHVFSGESGSAWDRTSVGLGFDSAEMLELPKKTRLRGRVAFEEARMARERFRKTKFALERRFTEIFVEWVSAREELAAAELALELLRTSSASLQRAAAASRTHWGSCVHASKSPRPRMRSNASAPQSRAALHS